MSNDNVNLSGDEARTLMTALANSSDLIRLFLKLQQLSLVQPPEPTDATE